MTPASNQSVTDLLQAWASGDRAALHDLLSLVYDELRLQAMRSILVDQARARSAAKRGGAARAITLDGGAVAAPEASVDVLALDEAAAVLGVSPATVKRMDHCASLAEARAECRLARS